MQLDTKATPIDICALQNLGKLSITRHLATKYQLGISVNIANHQSCKGKINMMMNRRKFLKGATTASAMGLVLMVTGCKFRDKKNEQNASTAYFETKPIHDGFRMPAEFEPHDGIWLVWPEQPEWRQGGKYAEKVYIALATAIAGDMTVKLAVTPSNAAKVRALMPKNVDVIEMDAGTGWVRDDGPTFLINAKGERRGVDWQFNHWGFPEADSEGNITAQKILRQSGAAGYRAPLVLEGGSIHSNGRGTIITTEECLLNENRNPDLSQAEIENHLKDYLGARKVIWLPLGVYEDSTSGHVDNMCCFVSPSEVLLTWTDDMNDPQYERSRLALEVLEDSTDADGNKITVHKLQQPGPLYITDEERDSMPDSRDGEVEERLPASYINYILTNNRLIFPLLEANSDELAKATFQKVFPKHQIIGVPGREILLHGGNFHCISQNLPSKVG